MARTTATIPDGLTDLVEGAVKAGIFENKSDAIRHALREYFEANQDAWIAAAVSLYEGGRHYVKTGEKAPSLRAGRMST